MIDIGKRVEFIREGAEGGGDRCIQNYTGKDSMRGSKKDSVHGDERFTDGIGSRRLSVHGGVWFPTLVIRSRPIGNGNRDHATSL